MITPENLPIHELCGLRARVVSSLSLPHKGLSGIVVDETKNTIVLSVKGAEKVVPKRGCTFRFTLPGGGKALLEGDKIAFRPYDRPKKVR
jgi:ribonuclease P protein subunit POP4